MRYNRTITGIFRRHVFCACSCMGNSAKKNPGAAKKPASAADRARFMQMAIDLSEQAADTGKGGPFGAVIVKGNVIAGSSGNCVYKNTDPTSHAEIMAIRDACDNLNSPDLSGYDIYSSGEPCPMCMAAIYWAKIEAVYFCNTEQESLQYGFIDKIILAELRKQPERRRIKSRRIVNPAGIRVFQKAIGKKAKNE